jgi:hypothetical protein
MSGEASVPAGPNGLVDRAKAIMMQPKTEWPRIAGETTEPMALTTSYVIPLALIGPIASFIGSQLFGFNAGIVSVEIGVGAALGMAVTTFVMSLVGVFLLAFLASLISPQFGGRKDFAAAFRLVAYAYTAAWIGGIFGLVPALSLLSILFGLYSLYLLYLGSGPVMGVPQDKTVGFTVATVVAAIVVYLVIGLITATVTGSLFMASAGAMADNDVTNATIDMGELGQVELDGDTATLTVDGETVEMDMAEIQAAAERAAAEAEAANAQ